MEGEEAEVQCEQLYLQIFKEIDKDGDGYISLHEFQQALRKLDLPPQQVKKQKKLFREIDSSNDSKIDQKEFVNYLKKRKEEFKNAYEQITNTKYITARHIRKFLKRLDLEASDEEIRAFLKQLSNNRDHATFNDFQKFFALMPAPVNAHAIFEHFFHSEFIDQSMGEYSSPIDFDSDEEESGITAQEIIHKLGFGAIAGGISRTVTAPIDRLKIILQTQIKSVGLVPVIKNIYEVDGFKGFFKGNGVNCIKVAPETAIKFLMFDYLKKKMAEDPENVTGFERFLAGGIAGGVAQICIYPLEITKTRMALSKTGQYKNLADCMKKIVGESGVRSIFAGLFPSLIGIFPYAGIDLSINSILRDMASSYLEKKEQEPGVGVMLSCGMISSSIGMMCTAPLNIIRTRLQSNGLLPPEQQYKGALDCFKRIFQQEGFFGFYKGMVPAMMKVLPATSISYTIFGMLNRQFQKNDQKN